MSYKRSVGNWGIEILFAIAIIIGMILSYYLSTQSYYSYSIKNGEKRIISLRKEQTNWKIQIDELKDRYKQKQSEIRIKQEELNRIIRDLEQKNKAIDTRNSEISALSSKYLEYTTALQKLDKLNSEILSKSNELVNKEITLKRVSDEILVLQANQEALEQYNNQLKTMINSASKTIKQDIERTNDQIAKDLTESENNMKKYSQQINGQVARIGEELKQSESNILSNLHNINKSVASFNDNDLKAIQNLLNTLKTNISAIQRDNIGEILSDLQQLRIDLQKIDQKINQNDKERDNSLMDFKKSLEMRTSEIEKDLQSHINQITTLLSDLETSINKTTKKVQE
jgi:predicted  nucleic acid-binding Zn-ribbon protein